MQLGHQLLQGHGAALQPRGTAARELEDLVDHDVEAVRLLDHEMRALPPPLRCEVHLFDHRRVTADRGHGIAKVVDDGGDHAADGGEPLGLQALLQQLDVAQRGRGLAGQDGQEPFHLARELRAAFQEDPSEERAAQGDGDGARVGRQRGRQPHRALIAPPAELGFDRLAHLDRERGGGRGRPPRPIARADLRDGLGLSRAREGARGLGDQAQDPFGVQRLRESQADLVQALQVAAAPLQADVLAADAADHLVEAPGQLLDLVAAADLERRVQVAFGGADRARHQLGQGPGDAAGQHEGAEHAQGDGGEADAAEGQAHVADLGLHLLRREHEPHGAQAVLAGLRENRDRHVEARLHPRHPVPAGELRGHDEIARREGVPPHRRVVRKAASPSGVVAVGGDASFAIEDHDLRDPVVLAGGLHRVLGQDGVVLARQRRLGDRGHAAGQGERPPLRLARDDAAQALLDEQDREGHDGHHQRRKVQEETGLQPDARRQASGARTVAVGVRQGQECPSIIPGNVRHPGR